MQLFFIFCIYCISDLVCFTDIGTAFSKDPLSNQRVLLFRKQEFPFHHIHFPRCLDYELHGPENLMTTVGNSFLKCQLHKFLRWWTHIFIPLPERNNGKSHTFTNPAPSALHPTVKSNFFYMVLFVPRSSIKP